MLEAVRLLLLTAHLLGMAAIVGTFFVQMRLKSGFSTRLVLVGAIVQVVSGLALVGVRYAADIDTDHVKIAVKLGIGIVVLVAAVLAEHARRGGGRVKSHFHTAGGLAVMNVLVAALWQ